MGSEHSSRHTTQAESRNIWTKPLQTDISDWYCDPVQLYYTRRLQGDQGTLQQTFVDFIWNVPLPAGFALGRRKPGRIGIADWVKWRNSEIKVNKSLLQGTLVTLYFTLSWALNLIKEMYKQICQTIAIKVNMQITSLSMVIILIF